MNVTTSLSHASHAVCVAVWGSEFRTPLGNLMQSCCEAVQADFFVVHLSFALVRCCLSPHFGSITSPMMMMMMMMVAMVGVNVFSLLHRTMRCVDAAPTTVAPRRIFISSCSGQSITRNNGRGEQLDRGRLAPTVSPDKPRSHKRRDKNNRRRQPSRLCNDITTS